MKVFRRPLLAILLFVAWAGSAWAYEDGPPANRSGVTGSTCTLCHSGGAGGGLVSISGLPAAWSPGETYVLQISIAPPAVVHGFQMTAVDSNGAQAGAFVAGAGMEIQQAPVSGHTIQHIQHSTPSFTPSFSFEWTAPASVSMGDVRFNLAANAANGDGSSFGDSIYTDERIVSPIEDITGGTSVYLAEVADGILSPARYLTTTIFVSNPSAQVASVALTFKGQDGSPMNLSFVDSNGSAVGSGNTISTTLAAGETRRYRSPGTGGLVLGVASVTSGVPVTAVAVISYFDGTPGAGALIADAAVNAAEAFTAQAIFVDESQPFTTLFAYANPSGTGATVTFDLLSTIGSVVATTTRPLAAGSQESLFLPSLFGTVSGHVGTLRITSTVPIVATALRFSGERFTGLPAFAIEP